MPEYSEDYDEDNLRLDPLEEGMDPPEHWSEADRFGMTESEARQGQDLDHRLREEQPDIEPEFAERPIGATPDEELDESIDDLTDDVDVVSTEELPIADPTGAVRRGQSADEAGGSVADEIRTPPPNRES
ncbi:MAG TPA: hypothetical protein VGX25_32590 [Actinophytocola sp.]|uniref:hypothetical protein n=1 Tax=Actinophytocola sp. TaxID=1872138 RepID=UPI002DDD8A9A|nr:hypothetical protein [Actinophytocola sp.]HEV2784150.1 hypothetical protein [Actinophytocola sp.]